MKRKLFFLFLLIPGLLLLSCSSEKSKTEVTGDIPLKVQDNFKEKFSKTTKVEWEVENGYYEAEYSEDGVEKTVVFDKQGNIIVVEFKIEPDILPANVIGYINENYPDSEIEEAEKVEKEGGNFYKVEIEDADDVTFELMFDMDGNFVSAEMEDDSDEGEGDEEEVEETEIELDIASLPVAITSYISENYPDYTIAEAEEESSEEGTFIDVDIEGPDGNEIELVFDTEGNFIKIEED